MTVFASVFAVLSPNLVSRIPEGQTKTDLFESLENECGVVLGKGVEDVCTIQGNWESLQRVYNFLEGTAFIEASGLENEAKVLKKTHITQVLPCGHVSNEVEDEPTTSDEGEGVDGNVYSNTSMISILNGPVLEHSENIRENHAEEKKPASDDENDLSGIQIVATWGNAFSEDVPNIPQSRVACDEVKQEPVSDTEDSLDKETIMQSYNEHYSLSQPVFPGLDPFNEKEKNQNQKSTSSSDLCLPNAESITANCSSLLAGILCSSETKLKLKNKLQTEKKENNPASVTIETGNNHANGDESLNKDGCVEKRDQIKIIIRPPKMPPKKRNKSKKSMKKSLAESKVTDPAKLRVTHEMKCGLCSTKKRFRTVDELNQHNHTHHMTLNAGSGRYKTHACSVCGKVLLSKHSLEEHLYVHQGLRPFSCSYCSMTFNHRKSLRRHELLHTDTQRLACQTCGKTFNRKDSLKSHIKAHEHCEDKKIEETEEDMT